MAGTVSQVARLKELRIFIDEESVDFAREKLRVLKDVEDEGRVGVDAANSELTQCAAQFGTRFL